MSLLVDYCTHEAAKYAALRWHYSKSLPQGRLVKCGVWEDDQFVGAVIFARGASPHYGHRYDLKKTEVCELARVALTNHTNPVTQIISRALKSLKVSSPGLRLVVSFADSGQGHLGTIYQAGNWTYLGVTSPKYEYLYHGRWVHDRTINGRPGWPGDNNRDVLPEILSGITYTQLKASLPRRLASPKFRYAYPLDKKIRRLLEPKALPYPTKNDLAVQVSEAKHQPSGLEGRVQSLGTAPN